MTLTLVFTFLLIGSTYANQSADNPNPPPFAEQREEMQKMHEEMKAAIEAGDYEAWKAIVSELPNGADLLEKINEDNFAKLVEAHKLMEEARVKMEEAKAIMEELGMPGPQKHPPFGKGMGRGLKNFGQWRSQQNNTENE